MIIMACTTCTVQVWTWSPHMPDMYVLQEVRTPDKSLDQIFFLNKNDHSLQLEQMLLEHQIKTIVLYDPNLELVRRIESLLIPAERDGRLDIHPDLSVNLTPANETVNPRKAGLQSAPPVEQRVRIMSQPVQLCLTDCCQVIVDTREFRSQLPSLIHRRGIAIEPVTLEVGDYVLSPDSCVERKSVPDLIGSLNSGRLFTQAQSMLRHYSRALLLIEFDPSKSFSFQANRPQPDSQKALTVSVSQSEKYNPVLKETKLNEKYNLKYKNYNILRKDRNKEGGGLAFLIKNLYYEDIAINIPNTSDLEAQGIKVYLNQNKTINIFNMYHPPNNKLIDDGTMAQFLTDNTIIVGDLNAKHQLWGCSTPNPRGKILSNLFDDNAFMCLNDGNPTHHSYSYNTAQALDISFSSPDIFHKCKWQILKSIGSDHLPILIEISTKTKTSSIKEKFWNFKKANWNLYQQNTNEDFIKAPTRIKDLEQNWISFKNTIIKAAKDSIPRGNIKKWIPNYTHQAKDIQTLITKRNELQKKYTQNQTNCRTELNIVNAKIKRLYVNMKREKWKQTCENLNPRNPNTKLWHLAKQIDRAQPQTENTNMIKNIDGTPATNDKNAANLLGNSYQISSKIKFEIKDKKVEKKARKIIHDCKNVTSTYNIFHEKINMKELDYALENTDLNKTPGPDGIHGQMISNLGKNGKEKLLDIFNNSWKTGKLPQDWKTATIIPIKKLDKSADDPKNYRPISLTSICCKLMEKIILRRLTYHLDTRNLLPEEQYGFRKGHGTIDQLLFFTQKVKDAQNRKPTNHTIAAFLDLTQAFDKDMLLKLPGVNSRNQWALLSKVSSFSQLVQLSEAKLADILDNKAAAASLWAGLHYSRTSRPPQAKKRKK
ncbi:hypothetical protein LAZ67_11000775 [Cordylochernes scorpioides]|uniref:ERCC4 domain-containing protein n=1 Tax=Cordylochernes scorpioides TaxID=51811 RepID=A0ABY6KYP3_9ARAC|nr:hypothetical protein LAZ67_11000775 [Cordylochernes scorpioides]